VVSKVLAEYPPAEILRRVVRAWVPDVIFLALEEVGPAEVISRQLESEFPGTQRIGLHTSQDPSTFRLALRLRMLEVLVAPFDRNETGDVLAQAASALELNPPLAKVTNRFFAFVPAKSGVGASTIAANTTWAFGRSQQSQVLLADFDLSSGISGFLFNTEHEHQISDALARAGEMDEDAWQRLVKKTGNIDLLLSGAPCIPDNIGANHVHRLIEFMRRNYDIINADLSDQLSEISLAVLREADRIILVTTPELPAVRMARLKTLMFQRLDLGDKVRLVVNRVRKGTMLNPSQIEETVGLPILASFPCDYAEVSRAIQDGKSSSALTESVESFAEKILDKKLNLDKRTRFIERFAMTPMRYAFR
jgi:pilus assembly protein CpaE